jgi:pimeloyl-ACP methyl ester carboxylesterase
LSLVSFESRLLCFRRRPRALVPAIAVAVLAGGICTGRAMPLARPGAPGPPGRTYLGDETLVPPTERSLLRAEAWIVDPPRHGQMLLMTLGGPVYCQQLYRLARRFNASLLCTDYALNGEHGDGTRSARREDWGDPAYLDAVSELPARLKKLGVRFSKLTVVGVSYSGFAGAELVATHPQLRPTALVVIDSFLDLTARYSALTPSHETRAEMEAVIGGTPADHPDAYADRSPSHHLNGIAAAMDRGMRFVDVWSVAASEQREFRGATCSEAANAQWLAELATLRAQPVTGYVTHMRHAHALWDHGATVLALAGLGRSRRDVAAFHQFDFRPDEALPEGSYCQAASSSGTWSPSTRPAAAAGSRAVRTSVAAITTPTSRRPVST